MLIQTTDHNQDYPDLPPCRQCGATERRCHDILFNEVSVNLFSKILQDAQEARGWPDTLVENIDGGYRLIGPSNCDCPQ